MKNEAEFKITLERIDKRIIKWMRKEGVFLLRLSLGIIFVWFGALKVIGTSPATELVAKTVYWVSPTWFVPFLGWWEVVIGLCLLWKRSIRLGIGLMAVQMVGTFLPLILLPEVVYNGSFFYLTMEGQYILKNLVIIAAGIVIGSHTRD